MSDVAYNSAIVDPCGHVMRLDISPAGKRRILIANVALGAGNTLYSHLGDWLGWLNLFVMVFFMIVMRSNPEKKK